MTSDMLKQAIEQAAATVRQTNPLTPSITNTVTINFVANAQLAVGGSAAMVYLPDEGEGLARICDAMYINVGTLFPIYAETLPKTAKTLHEEQKPWVLDPVAIGLGKMRTDLLTQFKEYKPSIIRGNASEIIALAGLWNVSGGSAVSDVRGVDSTDTVQAAKDAAMALASWTGGAVAVSGKEDLITDGKQVALSRGGSPMMPCITGTGCSLGGVMAVYAAAADPFVAAVTGAAVYNLAGSRAEQYVKGTGSFQTAFIDELYTARPADIAANPFTLE
ncbi:hydroxyethylthiazole kinase [Megasphaera sp. AM44-1BH]|jgi:hydroxyethylthiazole kinase|uniref:hydroxyethylthiazole kinase n=1 Tax=Megasphaera sp. AM44-1BH TaxID=2292358 RepID=UPI000E504C94|nr:hydroxyethylthiazole kinase [Megasphaera sp. AM44-1BH]RHA08768.1 hydroxyethylthiazole kinase [Megasphaera sp. AM44-1BH]